MFFNEFTVFCFSAFLKILILMTTLPTIHENQTTQPWQTSAIFLNYVTDNRHTCPKNVKINNTNIQEVSTPHVFSFLKYSVWKIPMWVGHTNGRSVWLICLTQIWIRHLYHLTCRKKSISTWSSWSMSCSVLSHPRVLSSCLCLTFLSRTTFPNNV